MFRIFMAVWPSKMFRNIFIGLWLSILVITGIGVLYQSRQPDPPPVIDNDEVRVVKWDPIRKTLAKSDRPRLILSIRSQYREWLDAGMTPVTGPQLTSGPSFARTIIPETVVDIIIKKTADNASLSALQQFNGAKNQWEWKDPLDPSKIDPKHFTFSNLAGDAFELDLRVPAGESTPLYERGMNRVLVYITDQNVRVADEAGNVTTVQHKAGDVEWAGPARQRLTNLGKDFNVVSVEFMGDSADHTKSTPSNPARQSPPPSQSPAAVSAPSAPTESEAQSEPGKQRHKRGHGRARGHGGARTDHS